MTRIELPETLEVGTLTGLSRDAVYLRNFLRDDDDTQMGRTFISFWDGSIFTLLRIFDYEICDIYQNSDGILHVLGAAGQYHTYDGESWTSLSDGIEPAARFSVLKILDGTVFALGPRGVLYRYSARDGWEVHLIGAERAALRDIVLLQDGTRAFCGTKGLFGTIDQDDKISIIDLQTNANLFGLLPTNRGLLVMGANGTVFYVANDERIDVGEKEASVSYFNGVEFEGSLFLSARTSVMKLSGLDLEIFKDGFSFRLRRIGDVLFNQEPNSVQVFDHNRWNDFPIWLDIPDAGPLVVQQR